MSIDDSLNLVFASGVLIPQMVGGQEYFRGLRSRYPKALIPEVPVPGSIAQRAEKLAESIERRFPSGPVHIVAHSMGMDARYMICKNLRGMDRRVRTLSTLSTPHQGTPIADFIVAPEPHISNVAERALYKTIAEAMRLLGWPSGAAEDLCTTSATKFNQENPDRPEVRYFGYAGVGVDSFALKPLHAYLEAVGRTAEERQNDGTVPLASAMRGGELAEPPWRADHYAIVGHNFNRAGFASDFDHFGAIERVVARAAQA